MTTHPFLPETDIACIAPLAPDQKRKEAQPRDHMLGRECRCAGAIVPEHEIVEAHRASREQRYRGLAPQDRIEPRDRVDFGLHRFAHSVRRHQKRQEHESGDSSGSHGRNSKCNALDANGRGHDAPFIGSPMKRTLTEEIEVQTCKLFFRNLRLLCDAFVAGGCADSGSRFCRLRDVFCRSYSTLAMW